MDCLELQRQDDWMHGKFKRMSGLTQGERVGKLKVEHKRGVLALGQA